MQWSRSQEPVSQSSVILYLSLGSTIIDIHFFIVFQNYTNTIQMFKRFFKRKEKTNIKTLASFSFPFDKLPKHPFTTPCDHHHHSHCFSSDHQLFGLSYSYRQLIGFLYRKPVFTHSQGHSLKSHSDQIIPLIQTLQVAFFCPR